MVLPTDSASAALKFKNDNSTHFAFCILGIKNDDALTADIIAQNIHDNWDESLSVLQSEHWGLVTVEVKLDTGEEFTYTATSFGEFVGDTESPQVALLVKKSTGFSGRENRGRMYIPGVPTSEVDHAGALEATYLADVTTAATAFMDKCIADSMPIAIFHHDGPPPTLTTVTSMACDPVVATQRRRVR